MAEEIAPTTKSAEVQMQENMDTLKKSMGMGEAVNAKMQKMQSQIDIMRENQRRADIPQTFLGPVTPFVKSFDDHLFENGMTLDEHLELAAASLQGSNTPGGQNKPAVMDMMKSINDRANVNAGRKATQETYDNLQKSFGSRDNYVKMMKSILGDAGTPGAPGAWYHFLEENLSPDILRIMLSNEDTTALQAIPTSITTNIVPEVPRLRTYGVGFGKHTMGFAEGRTAQFGGGQLMDRLTHTLVQRGIRAAVTEMLIANRQKLVSRNPLALERELRILEFNLGKNTQLLYGDEDINKDGSTILEHNGLLKQMQDTSTGYPDHILDWNGVAFDDGAAATSPLTIFRRVAEDLIYNGHLPGGVVTGKYSVLMDFSVANNISTVIDDKQRVQIEQYERAALYYGQAFSGFVTDLGTFMFKRSKTLYLTENDTWTADADVSNHAVVWPLATLAVTAIPQATVGEAKSLPVGTYRYRVSAVNDHGESDVADAIVGTTDGTIPVDVAADEVIEISIPYDADFAGGTVGGFFVSPVRYFLLYRNKVDENDTNYVGEAKEGMSCIAKIPINGTSTTTYVDYDQKMPGTTDMFFISNNPADIAHCSLTPAFELPLWDILFGSTKQWMIMDIAALCTWAPMRQYVVRNVPELPRI